MITRDELKDLHASLTEKAYEVMTAKNADYASSQDPLRNFRSFEEFGIVVRLSDKVARLRTFCERGVLDVKDESVEDTLVDIINYAVLFAAYLQDRKPPTSNVVQFPAVNAPIESGPYCEECAYGNLADFADYDPMGGSPIYWCSSCAADADIDTTNMALLEQVA